MANLQVLRKRYKSIQATADMASALKTASSVKYSKISRVLMNIDAYSRACDETLALFGNSGLKRRTKTVKNKNCLVFLSNDRGFCGGFNGELIRFFEARMAEESEPPLLIVYGKKGIAFCREKGFTFETSLLADVPTYADAEALTNKLYDLYASGEVNQVFIIHQHFVNMMQQIPTAELILPHQQSESDTEKDFLFLPDKETAIQTPSMYCLTNSVYHILLGHCAGIQAATSIAMRSACDNADKSLDKLETLINRIRQAEVTNSVIETSSYLIAEE